MYYDSIRQTIREGGDTDTTACIVGGMIGALVGLKNLPQNFKDKMTEFDCEVISKDLYKWHRPHYLSVKNVGIRNIQ